MKVKLITQANASTQLSYDANHNRAIQTIRNDDVKIKNSEYSCTDALGVADGSSYFDSFVGTAVAHGTTQGLIAEVSGGSFQSGFAAGFSGHLAGAAGASFMGSGTDAGAVISRTTIAATMGGLVAQATGGNFQDGAYQAAMVHLFNRLGRRFSNPREQYLRSTGKIDYLGRNKQQQANERFLQRQM